jgi:hypothetical protein
MTDGTLLSDYDRSDGWNANRGLNLCPHCERLYSGNGGYIGPVFNQDGREFETYFDTDPSKGPWFCKSCWTELERNQKQDENRTLTEWSE